MDRDWIRPIARRFLAYIDGQTRPRQRDVVAFLERDRRFRDICERHPGQIHIAHWLTPTPPMQPIAAAATWNIPAIPTVQDLALRLHLSAEELLWLADLKGLTRNTPKLHNYNYRWHTKTSGALRLIESPKPLLKSLQRRILSDILAHIPPHPAVHGFVRSRSIKTFAAPHYGQSTVLRLDLQDFFPSIRRARVQAIFRTLGYPESVADLLGGLCTNAAPRSLFRNLPREPHDLYTQTHLPQGAPTSPTLANICAHRMDCRLAGLAAASGATYTRYADDLAFSGSSAFQRNANRFALHVAAIALEEGFPVNHHKTRIMRQSVRQHLAGVVINQKPNVSRADFDRLKAVLTNCIRNGPAAENRENLAHFRAHLQGRIAHINMLNAARGTRLRRLFHSIDWPIEHLELD